MMLFEKVGRSILSAFSFCRSGATKCYILIREALISASNIISFAATHAKNSSGGRKGGYMKQSFLILLLSLVCFFGAWTFKVRASVARPQDAATGIEQTAWYENKYTAPKPDEAWILDPEIPLNYIPVPGEDEVYMVMSDAGDIQKYRQRRQLSDGTWQWSDIDYDNSNGMEAVDGQDCLYAITGEDGKKVYKKFVKHDDNSFCYVDTDSKGKPLDIGTSAETITPDYVHLDGNTYAKYNGDGVMEGYRERVKDGNGNLVWAMGSAPTISTGGLSVGMAGGMNNGSMDAGVITNGVSVPPVDTTPQTIQNGDGTYTEKETQINTETVNGQQITYQTVITRVYDAEGNLLETSKDGPHEVSRETLGSGQQPNPANIAGSLEGEVARVSASVSYDTAMAQDILALLNAERISAGLPQLSMDTQSEAYKVALIKAADMATYDYASANSPTYGTIGDIVARFSLASASPSENIWKASSQTAQDVHTRFQSNNDSRTVRMSTGYTSVGIAVVQQSGQTYVAEVYLQ